MSEDIKECNKCMYCKKDNYCMRKKDKIATGKICGHYVNKIGSLSMCKFVEEMLNISNLRFNQEGVREKVEESHRLAHLNKLSNVGNFLKCYRV